MTGVLPIPAHAGGVSVPVPHSVLLAVVLVALALATTGGVLAAEALLARIGI